MSKNKKSEKKDVKEKKLKKTRKSKKSETSIDPKIILSHNLVPKMRVLTDKESKKILEKYNIDKSDLPRMYPTDPEAVALKAKPNDIIEITRKDITGTYKSYRIVL